MVVKVCNLEAKLVVEEGTDPLKAVTTYKAIGALEGRNAILRSDGSFIKGYDTSLGTLPVELELSDGSMNLPYDAGSFPIQVNKRGYDGIRETSLGGDIAEFMSGFYEPIMSNEAVIKELKRIGELKIPKNVPWAKKRRRNTLIEYLGLGAQLNEFMEEDLSEKEALANIDVLIEQKLTREAYDFARSDYSLVEAEEEAKALTKKEQRKRLFALIFGGAGASGFKHN